MALSLDGLQIENLADHPDLVEPVALLRWQEWAYGNSDPTEFVEVTANETGDGEHLPMTLVAIDRAGQAVGVVGLGQIDEEVGAVERAGRTPWILGMVVAKEARGLGIGRRLLIRLQTTAAELSHLQSWVATGDQAVGFYRSCGWAPVEHLRLESTGIPTTILTKPTTPRALTPNATVQRNRDRSNGRV